MGCAFTFCMFDENIYKMATIRFELRNDKPNKQGKYPIRIIYSISGARKFFPTSEKCATPNWNAKEQRVVYIKKCR
jgi:hypothetical protein